jgi:hypothetical protein
MHIPRRREFLKALLFSAGGAAVVALPGCSASAEGEAFSNEPNAPREWNGPVETETTPARVQPGLRYANTLPARVPSVRRINVNATAAAAL